MTTQQAHGPHPAHTMRILVPEEGIEPTLHCWNRILSPARLPVPPFRLRSRLLRPLRTGIIPQVHTTGKPTSSEMRLSDFDFQLPDELIAQYPAAERTTSRLMCVARDRIEHRHFSELRSEEHTSELQSH